MGTVKGPGLRQFRPDVALAVDPDQIPIQLPKEQTFTVVSRDRGVCRVHRISQRYSEGIESPRRIGGKYAGISRLRRCWGRGGSRCAAGKSEQQEAAARVKRYDPATTNGLPPNLALIAGKAAAASPLVTYSPTRTL